MINRWRLWLVLVAQLPNCLTAELLDFENERHGFITETHQIHIPGHPNAFNPSLVRWNGTLLMSFREIVVERRLSPWPYETNAESLIGLVWLDDDLQPIGEPQMFPSAETDQRISKPSRSEDARLVLCNNTLYIVYSDNCDEEFSDGGFRIYVAEIQQCLGKFQIVNLECLRHFEGENPDRREKNWTPFEYQGHLLLTYSMNPHRILRHMRGTGTCETVSDTSANISWPWGELRGGTPAIPLDDEHYLGFFHSSIDMKSHHSKGEWSLHYFMGAYLFKRNPPFAITKISPQPLVGPGFYSGADYIPYWKPVRVVFPGGVLIDGETILVAYGRQDHEIWIAKIDRRSLIESLIQVDSQEDKK